MSGSGHVGMTCVRVDASSLGPVLTAIRGGLTVAQAAAPSSGRTFDGSTVERVVQSTQPLALRRAALPTVTTPVLSTGAVAHPRLLHDAPFVIEAVPARIRNRYRQETS